MSDPALSPRARHHDVVTQLRRDLERERTTERDPLATAITLSAIEVGLDNAAADDTWDGVAAATTERLRAIGLDDATVAAWTNELVSAAGGPAPETPAPRTRRWRRARG